MKTSSFFNHQKFQNSFVNKCSLILVYKTQIVMFQADLFQQIVNMEYKSSRPVPSNSKHAL